MTVVSQVKSCFSSIKSAEATIMILAQKTQDEKTQQTFENVQQILSEVKSDLQQQVLYLTRQEPQYKQ